jgi:hypothetical protein
LLKYSLGITAMRRRRRRQTSVQFPCTDETFASRFINFIIAFNHNAALVGRSVNTHTHTHNAISYIFVETIPREKE